MYKQRFEKRKAWITANRIRLALFTFIYKVLPCIVFAAYPLLLVYLFFTHDKRLVRCIAVPLFTFVTLSAARYLLDLQRPYEKYDLEPIFPKSTVGKSFPSRHTASAAVIAAAILYVNIPAGAVFLVIAALIAVSRVLNGVHFPRDVAAGVIYALICSIIYLI